MVGRGRSRTAVVIAVAFAIGAVALAVGFFRWLPHYRPHPRAGERLGIDVSDHQGVIDWSAVGRDHIRFAYIKATEGGDFVDSRFAANWQAARAAGLDVGAYHFFTLCTPGSVQAANFLGTASTAGAALPPAVDLELAGNCSARPPLSAVETQLGAFLDAVESRTGQQAVLYLGEDFTERYDIAAARTHPLWVRRVLRRPGGPWLLWQATGYAHVDGISGDVDVDVQRAAARRQ